MNKSMFDHPFYYHTYIEREDYSKPKKEEKQEMRLDIPCNETAEIIINGDTKLTIIVDETGHPHIMRQKRVESWEMETLH